MGGLFVKFSCTKSGISSSILSFSRIIFIRCLCVFAYPFIFSFSSALILFRVRIRSRSLLLIVYNGKEDRILRRLPAVFVSARRKAFNSFFVHCGKFPLKDRHFSAFPRLFFGNIPPHALPLSDSICRRNGIRQQLRPKVRQFPTPSKMQKDIIRSILEIVGRNLPCHIHRYPAFKTKHHLIKRTVKIMYLMKMQSFLSIIAIPNIHFWELRILCHFFHRHIAVHYHRG